MSFNETLRLVGYDILDKLDGETAIRFFWYIEQIPLVDYSIFLHMLDATTGEMVTQNDQLVGSDTHPTHTWRKNELVFEEMSLPIGALMPPYHLRFGLYQLGTGTRVAIHTEDGTAAGDSQIITIP